MNYTELKRQVAANAIVPDYYEELIINAEDIMLDIALRGQSPVATGIGIAQSKLSAIKSILIAQVNINTKARRVAPEDQATPTTPTMPTTPEVSV